MRFDCTTGKQIKALERDLVWMRSMVWTKEFAWTPKQTVKNGPCIWWEYVYHKTAYKNGIYEEYLASDQYLSNKLYYDNQCRDDIERVERTELKLAQLRFDKTSLGTR